MDARAHGWLAKHACGGAAGHQPPSHLRLCPTTTQLVACTMCFMRNRKRGLGLFSTTAPDNAHHLLHSGLGHIHSTEPASGGTGLGTEKGIREDAMKTGFE